MLNLSFNDGTNELKVSEVDGDNLITISIETQPDLYLSFYLDEKYAKILSEFLINQIKDFTNE